MNSYTFGCKTHMGQETLDDGQQSRNVYGVGTGAVSYTHLDVYKRQVSHTVGVQTFLRQTLVFHSFPRKKKVIIQS